jgi:hypothetical protein
MGCTVFEQVLEQVFEQVFEQVLEQRRLHPWHEYSDRR